MNTYKTKGVCPKQISFDIKDDRIYKVEFSGGCHGNLQAISKLVEGENIDKVISKLKGIDCNGRGTSCPDQLAKALEEIKEKV